MAATSSQLTPLTIRRTKKRRKAESWRSVRWVNAAQPRGTGFAAVNPRKDESLLEFRKRVPAALPASHAAKLSETDRKRLSATARRRPLSERAIALRASARGTAAGSGQEIFEFFRGNEWLREAKASDKIVKDVLLIRAGPGNLADRHYYSKECLQNAAANGVFEGARCFFDHPDTIEERTRPERSVRRMAGWYSDVTCREYDDPKVGKTLGLFADFHPAVDNTEVLSIIRTCVEYAKRYPSKAYAGLSINAMGDGQPDTINGEEWNRVDEITEVESVDIVTRAGAGGGFVPLKESFRMPKPTDKAKALKEARKLLREAQRSRDPLALELTVDPKKLSEGLNAKIAELKEAGKKKLKESGLELTPEQDKALDAALGLVDGGALDKIIDEATGVPDDEDDDTIEDDDAVEDDAVEDGDEEDDDVNGDMPNDVKSLKAALKKEREAKREAKREAAKAVADAKKALKEASGIGEQASRVVREARAKAVVAELNIPETFQPRLIGELLEKGFTQTKQMREHAQAFDKAFIRPNLDAGGTVMRESRNEGGASKIDFTFEEK